MLKKILGFLFVLSLLFIIFPTYISPIQARSYRTRSSDVYVHGYYRKNGTYVQPYYRSKADSSITNNYSCIDNGRCGGGTPDTSDDSTTTSPTLFNSLFEPSPTPVPTLTPEEIAAKKCLKKTAAINNTIKYEEALKLKNVLNLRKLASNLEKKSASRSAEIASGAETYRLQFDDLTNKMYETTRNVCDQDQSTYLDDVNQEKIMIAALTKLRISIQKLYSIYRSE